MILLQSLGSGLAQLFFPIAIVVVAYFFILRPEQNKRKKQSDFVSNLKKGDTVVTAGGLHGKIIEIVEGSDSCVLETMAGKIRYEVSAISFEMSAKLNTKVTKK